MTSVDRLSLLALLTALILVSVAACSGTPASTAPVPAVVSTAPPTLAPTPAATSTPAATATLTATLLPALQAATIDGLGARAYNGGAIRLTRLITMTDAYTQVLMTYPSDDLNISAVMTVPPGGRGPFPTVILVHGFFEPADYKSGYDTSHMADVLTRDGYLTIAPDLRGYAQSGDGLNLFLTGYVTDVLNAAASAKRLPYVDANRIGLWGHSMGAGIATRALVVSDLFDAVVLYAPLSADINDLELDPLGGETVGVTQELVNAIVQAAHDDSFRRALSPRYYFDNADAPVSIHIGTADTVTPPAWALAIRDGLKQAGKNVEYFEYPDQGHVLQGDLFQTFDQRVLDFFSRTLH